MSFLAQVTTGVVKLKDFVLLLGTPGVGKTSFAISYPGAIVEDLERGSLLYNATRLPKSNSFKDVLDHLKELVETKHIYQTYVLDSLDYLETVIFKTVCDENGWKSIDEGAFGKGYAAALAKWTELFNLLKPLKEKMNIVLIAHSVVKTVNDPMKMQPYDRHEIKLQAKASALVKETCDAIFFCAFDILLKENKTGKAKALETNGVRVMYTQGRPSHEAKNRYGLPYKLPLSYEAYLEARSKNQPEEPQTLIQRITENIEALQDETLKSKAKESLEKAGDDAIQLSKILNRLEVLNSNVH